MALVVEDGSGVANAVTYRSETSLVAYALARGVALTEADAAPLLIAAMDRMTALDYKGARVVHGQALDWPRTCVCIDGYTYLSTDLPNELGDAQLAFALAERTTRLQPVAAAGAAGAVIEETLGPITTRYSDRGSNASALARVPAAEKLLEKLLRSDGANNVRLSRG